MRPSRTREERKNPTLYMPENELKQELEQQAALKKKTKALEALNDKAEILNHYENYKISGDPKNDELNLFLEQQKNQLNRAHNEFRQQDPEFYEIVKHNEQKLQQQREIKRKEQPQPIFADYMFKKETLVDGNAKIVSAGELEREKRLKLREQERLRRLAGIIGTAYEDPKNSSKPTTAETVETNILSQDKTRSLIGSAGTNVFPEEHPDPSEEARDFQRDLNRQKNQDREVILAVDYSIRQSAKPEDQNVYNSIGNTSMRQVSNEQNRNSQAIANKNVTASIQGGRPSVSEEDKKRKYKEELDELVRQKNESRQSTAKNSIPSIPPEKPASAESNKLSDWEKKKLYAEELMKEIVAKEKQKSRETLERRGGGGGSNNNFNDDQSLGRNKYSSSTAHRSEFENETNLSKYDPQESYKNVGSAQASRKDMMSQESDKMNEAEKKRKYKEELDALVQERKRVQSAKIESKEIKAEEPINLKRDDTFFLHKGEDEEDKRKRAQQLQKQKHAEDLKRQMEEKEEQKRREKLKKEQEDLRERDRIMKEAEMERLKHQQEIEFEKKKNQRTQSQELVLPIQEFKNNKVPVIQDNHDRQEEQSELGQSEANYPPVNYPPERNIDSRNFNSSQQVNYQNQPQNFYPQQQQYPQQSYPQGPQQGYPQGLQQGYPQGPQQGYPQMMNPGMYPQMQTYMYNPQPMYYPSPYMPPIGMDQLFMQQYGFNNQIYQDLAVQKNLIQQLLEEKSKIEKLAIEEKTLLDEYKTKIRDMKLEKYQFEKEIEKLRVLLENPKSVDSRTLNDNPHLLALQGLQTQRAVHIDNYNKLVQQSQQNLLGIQNTSRSNIQNNQSNIKLLPEDSVMEVNKVMRESLPSSSNYVQAQAKAELEKSFLKDVEAFKNMHKQFFHIDEEPSKIERVQDVSQLNQYSHYDKILAMSQNDSLSPNKLLLNKSEQNITTNYEFQTAGKNNKNQDLTTIIHGNFSENQTDRNPLVSPVVDTNRFKFARNDTTPQVNFEKSPEINFYNQALFNPLSKRMNDFSAFPQDSVVRESVEYKGYDNEHNLGEQGIHKMDLGQGGIKINESSMRFDLPLQRSYQENQKLSMFNHNKSDMMKLEELELKDKSHDISPPQEKLSKRNLNVEKLEIKMEDELNERSLIIAEDDEYDDALIDSNDPALLALKASLSKLKAEKLEQIFDPYQVVRLTDGDHKKMEGIVEKALIPQQKAGISLDVLKRNKTDLSSKSKDPEHLQSFDPNDFTNTQINIDDIKKNDGLIPKSYYPSTNQIMNFEAENFNPNRSDEFVAPTKNVKSDPFAKFNVNLHSNITKTFEDDKYEKPQDFIETFKMKKNAFDGQSNFDIDDKLNLRNRDNKMSSNVNDIFQNIPSKKQNNIDDLASTVDMNDYNLEEIRAKIHEINEGSPRERNQQYPEFEYQSNQWSPEQKDKVANEENQRRSKMILNRLTKLLEGYSDEENNSEAESKRNTHKSNEADIFKPVRGNKTISSRYV